MDDYSECVNMMKKFHFNDIELFRHRWNVCRSKKKTLFAPHFDKISEHTVCFSGKNKMRKNYENKITIDHHWIHPVLFVFKLRKFVISMMCTVYESLIHFFNYNHNI